MAKPGGYLPPPLIAESPLRPWQLSRRQAVFVGALVSALGFVGSQVAVTQRHFPALLLLAGLTVGLLLRLHWQAWPWLMGAIAVLGFAGGALAFGFSSRPTRLGSPRTPAWMG